MGFSGGPVIRRKAEDGKLYIVGIVSGYKYDAPQPVMEKTADGKSIPHSSHVVLPNSGFMYCVPSYQVLKLIDAVVPA